MRNEKIRTRFPEAYMGSTGNRGVRGYWEDDLLIHLLLRATWCQKGKMHSPSFSSCSYSTRTPHFFTPSPSLLDTENETFTVLLWFLNGPPELQRGRQVVNNQTRCGQLLENAWKPCVVHIEATRFIHTKTYKLAQLSHGDVCIENNTNNQSLQLGVIPMWRQLYRY